MAAGRWVMRTFNAGNEARKDIREAIERSQLKQLRETIDSAD